MLMWGRGGGKKRVIKVESMATWFPWLWWYYGCWHLSNASVWVSFIGSSCRGSLCEFAEALELSSLLTAPPPPDCQGLPNRSHKLTFLKDPRRRRREGTGHHSCANTPCVSGQPCQPWAWTWPWGEERGRGFLKWAPAACVTGRGHAA